MCRKRDHPSNSASGASGVRRVLLDTLRLECVAKRDMKLHDAALDLFGERRREHLSMNAAVGAKDRVSERPSPIVAHDDDRASLLELVVVESSLRVWNAETDQRPDQKTCGGPGSGTRRERDEQTAGDDRANRRQHPRGDAERPERSTSSASGRADRRS